LSRWPRLAILPALLLPATLLAGCETTQDKAEALREQGEQLIASQEGVVVTKENPDVKVLGTWLLHDQYGDAVAVRVQNTSDKPQVKLPINVDVRGANGKSVYANDVPGLDPSLTYIPYLAPKETTYWVNDQVLATGTPKSVKVKVGPPSEQAPAGPPPEIAVSEPRLHSDPSGIEVEGSVTNKSQIDQPQVVLFAVAERGGGVVAAGRGQFKNLTAGGKPLRYNIFFIGDPRGAELSVLVPPSALAQ
jgi:hypothetical protein